MLFGHALVLVVPNFGRICICYEANSCSALEWTMESIPSSRTYVLLHMESSKKPKLDVNNSNGSDADVLVVAETLHSVSITTAGLDGDTSRLQLWLVSSLRS